MDFVSKHLHFGKKRFVHRLFSNDNLGKDHNQQNDRIKTDTTNSPAADRRQTYPADGQKRKLLKRTLSIGQCKSVENEGLGRSWTVEDETNFNVEKQILKAKAEAKTVSVVDGDLYIDYQYVCPMPSCDKQSIH